MLTAGFAQGEAALGKKRASQLLSAAQPHLLRITGPNCLGIGLNAICARGEAPRLVCGRRAFEDIKRRYGPF